jgi:hypothetical protein
MLTIHGEPSFHLGTPELDLHVTARGGHMAPVVFHLPSRDVSPYALAPWEPAEYPELPPLLSVLRGDFMCLPFGGQSNGPPHGATANSQWTRMESDSRSLRCMIETGDTAARVVKTIATREGHHALYIANEISNLDGDFNYGNHPIIDFANLPEAAGRVSTSSFHWASVFPGPFANPADGETQALAEGSTFKDLSEVPLAAGGTTDLTRYPARTGHEDLVMVAHQPATSSQPFAWSAALLDGYVWFSLKNPADFPCTLLWLSNGGRTASPWNGRHLGRMGIEDVCSHFSDGVDKSRLNLLANRGIPTTRHFKMNETVTLRSLQAVAAVPEGFGMVTRIIPHDDFSVRLTDDSERHLTVELDWKFLP